MLALKLVILMLSMPNSVHLVPRNRLRLLPAQMRLAHEYCFFLHDQCARILTEYENARAHNVTIAFRNEAEAQRFSELAKDDIFKAMRETDHDAEARRVILNNITLAMTSDALHHIYEALRCLEKRKIVVALNLLRKPLMDSLIHLSWMLGNPDEFYATFSSGEPAALSTKRLGNGRDKIITDALLQTEIGTIIDSKFIRMAIFDRSYAPGLQKAFQHAVHLITVDYPELRTAPENFNLIFTNPLDDTSFEVLYENLPPLLFYLSHVIFELFRCIQDPEPGAASAFRLRSTYGLLILEEGDASRKTQAMMQKAFADTVQCPECEIPFAFTVHNTARALIAESLRCQRCRKVTPFPFSWLL